MSEMMKKATREGFGEEIVTLGKENHDILVVDVDIGKSCKTGAFRKELPEQYLNVGIAEQNAAGVAAGLATCGKIPFVVTYAAFGSMRMCEMIRQEICYPHLNVKIACSHGGVTPANDGASHQSIEDMGILRSIPNMTVIMPADYWAARKLVRAAAEMNGPVYLRFTRDAIPVLYDENAQFEIGKANLLKDGKDVAIIANGDTVRLALQAAETLAQKGISARVLDMHVLIAHIAVIPLLQPGENGQIQSQRLFIVQVEIGDLGLDSCYLMGILIGKGLQSIQGLLPAIHNLIADHADFLRKFHDIHVDASFSLFSVSSRFHTGPTAGCPGFSSPSGCKLLSTTITVG